MALTLHISHHKMWTDVKSSTLVYTMFFHPDHPDYVPSVFEYAKRYTSYVQQNKMVRYECHKIDRKIEFESIATSSKKVKESTEKLNTAVLVSTTPTQQTPQ
ncbi:hypothetical protein ACJMK2_035973 [Sinanodonta woodiana]|uniref:Uncharacterized protein n=1 Tax=Sinanodonta woodiana TaxID=1069815 RepID=A0ABD3WFY9_SINWO